MTRVEGSSANRKRALQINLALTELKTGTVVAQASALARDEGLDHTPLAYYRDSPVLVKDKVIEGYARTSATPPGQRGDAFYLERIAAATVINEATALYNQERYVEALGQYRSALAMPTGEQIRVMNGIYLTSVKLGRTAEAEQAFGRVVALGIAYNELGVKFLFNPGSTDFWSDTRVSGPYGMWLRQIAKEGTAAKVCMNVVGHTSKTGSEQVNDTLSLAARQLHPPEARPPNRRRSAAGPRRSAWAFARTSSAAAPTTRSTRSTGGSSSRSFPASRGRRRWPRACSLPTASPSPACRRRRWSRRWCGSCRAPCSASTSPPTPRPRRA